ncbi:uncharacterized protein CG3556 [Trichonephila inaurata madagascariensis]|uniref:Uncharacterized protein CG3556 n=1 Tax=Trichonephila inaurata madagascariensis TaxID=2747483 RepID=A0A8X7CKP7_9ARAC|nr:uncharacterized protein CG3556 [Trichonephila inaurata madagascariensis]
MESIRFLSFVFTFWGCLLSVVLCQNPQIFSVLTSRLSADECETVNFLRGTITDKTSLTRNYSKCWTIKVPAGGYIHAQVGKITTKHTCKQAYVEVSVGQTGAVYKFCSVDVNKNPVVASSDITVKLEVKGTINYQTSFDLEYIITRNHHGNVELRTAGVRHADKGNSFVCDDYLCIPEDKVCDGEVDCKNGEDEIKTKCDIQIRNLAGVEEALQSGINWLRSYKTTPWNWGDDISRAAIAFFLTSYSNFNGTNLEEELIAKQVELRTTLFLLRTKDKTNINELSMFINALLVTCYNPQDFYGTDLVKKLKTDVEASKTFTNPLAYLALCKGNETWPETAVANLDKVLNNSRLPFMIDLQAMAVMALSCQIKQNSEFSKSFDDALYKTAIQNFKTMQQQDGGFGNVYTSALITQCEEIKALLASGQGQNRKGWKLKETIEYLIKQLNSSSVDFLSTYMILPILNGKSLDDISQTHCSDSLRKLSDDPASDVRDYVGPVKRIYYSLYIGDEKDSTITISLRVPETYTVTQIMNLAASTDSKYKYESSIVMGQKYVYKIGNTANDPESGKFWLMYVGTYDIKDDTLKLSETDPDEIVMKEGEHLVMWYRTADIQFSEEEPEIKLQFM